MPLVSPITEEFSFLSFSFFTDISRVDDCREDHNNETCERIAEQISYPGKFPGVEHDVQKDEKCDNRDGKERPTVSSSEL